MKRLYQTSGGSAGTTRFQYDGTGLVAEYNSSNGMLRRYVHGPGSDEPLVWYEGSSTTDRRFLHADERGSIVAVTNSSGTTLNVNAYDEYGIPASGNVRRFQYTGQFSGASRPAAAQRGAIRMAPSSLTYSPFR